MSKDKERKGRRIDCAGCSEEFTTMTAEWSDHYRTCHKPALNAQSWYRQEEEFEAERQIDMDLLMDSGISSDASETIVNLVIKRIKNQ